MGVATSRMGGAASFLYPALPSRFKSLLIASGVSGRILVLELGTGTYREGTIQGTKLSVFWFFSTADFSAIQIVVCFLFYHLRSSIVFVFSYFRKF